MWRLRFLIVLPLAFSAIPPAQAMIQAAPPEPSEEIVVKGEIPDANKRVCKLAGTTGSIIPKRECRSKGEWEEIRARSIATFERMKADQQQRRHLKEMLENQ